MKFGKLGLAMAIAALAAGCAAKSKAQTATPSAPGKLKLNVFVDGGDDDPQQVVALSHSLGVPIHGITTYHSWDNDVDTNKLRHIHDAGFLPQLTWESWLNGEVGVLYSPINKDNGEWDKYINRNLASLRDLGFPVRMCPFPEANLADEKWYVGAKGNSPELYKSAFRKIMAQARAIGATNLEFVWDMNIRFNGDTYNYRELYPGDESVDAIALDGYNNPDWSGRFLSFREVFGRSYQEITALAPSKPVYIMETASAEKGGDKAAYIADMCRDLPTLFPNIRELTWFDTKKEADWRFDSSPATLAAAQQWLPTVFN